jgi:hypothetical protein
MNSKRNKMSEITDIAQALHDVAKLREEIHKYFIYDSEVCRALQTYIEKDPKPHCLFKWDRSIRNTSAHSGVHFHEARIYSPIRGINNGYEYEVILFTFNVDLIDDEDNETQERVTATVPASWEKNFTKAKFNKWVKEEKSKIVKNNDHKIVYNLAKKYDIPVDLVKRFLDHI